MKLQLVGGDYAAQSPASNAQSCVNLYPELVDGVSSRGPLNPALQGKSAGALYGTPGRVHLGAGLGGTNIRGMFSVNGRVWVVTNGNLCEINTGGTAITTRAGLTDDGLPAQILWNGHQICVVSGGSVYIDDGSSMVAQTFEPSTGLVGASDFAGTVNTLGAQVIWVSGATQFVTGTFWVGKTITINGTPYAISAVISPQLLIISSSAGTQSSVPYLVTPSGIYWQSGDKFITDGSWTGATITLNGVSRTIIGVVDDQFLLITANVGALTGVGYSVTGPAVTATFGCYLDGYFIVQRPAGGTPDLGRQFNISALNNGTSWSALDFAVKESYPDNTQSLLAANEQLYVFGSESIEVWQNTGGTVSNPFPFSRIPGSVSRFGVASRWSQVALDGNVYFLGGDGTGNVRAYVLNGWSPVPVSTPAEEYTWFKFFFGLSAIAFPYSEEGHSFWVISQSSVNSGPGQTWVYDQNTGTWHQRYRWSGSAFTFNATSFHCFAYNNNGSSWGNGGGYHLVADLSSGTIYRQSLGYTDDDNNPMKWQRALPYTYQGNQRLIGGRVTLEMETGGIASGTAPSVTLDWSDDRGKTFHGTLSAAIGTAGQTWIRVYWTRTGGLSGNGGLTRGRIYRVSGVVPGSGGGYRPALIDLEADATVCG